MKFHFTKHANEKFKLVEKAGFPLEKEQVKNAIAFPARIDKRPDGTEIASKILDSTYALRVVYRKEGGIIIVITFYPAHRKDYDI